MPALDNLTLRERVHEHLRQGILDGRYPPGTVLLEVPLADELGVSRGPLREALVGRAGITTVGAVQHDDVPRWLNAADVVCQPSIVEPFGLTTLEAMACARSVVATHVGGPPEFVAPGAGILVDPEDGDALVRALGQAASLPRPNAAAREAAERHDLRCRMALIEAVLERVAPAAAGATARP